MPKRITDRLPSSISGIDPWRTLEALSFYRAAVCVALMSLMGGQYRPAGFGSLSPGLMDAGLYVYLFVAALLLVLVRGQRPAASWQAALQIAIDLIAILSFVYSSRGVTSGLGMLLLTPIVAGSLLLDRRLAVLIAALATLGLLFIELYLNLGLSGYSQSFTQTGMLGAALFIIALSGSALAKRARESEARATQAEVSIAKLQQLSETVIHRLQAGVIVVDTGGQIELLNHAARELLGERAVTGISLLDLDPVLWRRLDVWRHSPAGLTNSAVELPNGRSAWAQFTRLGRGARAATLIVLDDASRVAEQAQSLKLAALGRLTASIAHELRNPLAAIQNAAELMHESPQLSGDDQNLTAIIRRQTLRLNSIISNILSLSRKSDSQSGSAELGEVIRQCIEDFQHSGDAPVVEVSLPAPGIQVRIDSLHLAQIITNLLENAAHHARVDDQALKIRIDASVTTTREQAIIDFHDNGPGIDAATAAHIFEPFFSTRHSGTGLGLFITRELCEAAGGQLQLIPGRPGSGAYFRLSFPVAAASKAA